MHYTRTIMQNYQNYSFFTVYACSYYVFLVNLPYL